MATIKYNGMELEEFTSDKPVIFDPPKKCVVRNEIGTLEVSEILGYDPRRFIEARFIGKNGASWGAGAILPEKPAPRRVTNRELAKWLAQGNGEISGDTKEYTIAGFYYAIGDENTPAKDELKVRKWDDTEWHEPTVEYMGIEEAK